MSKKPPLGSGKRFADLVKKLSKQRKVKNPRRLAAWIMWQKYGKKRGSQLIRMGKRHGH